MHLSPFLKHLYFLGFAVFAWLFPTHVQSQSFHCGFDAELAAHESADYAHEERRRLMDHRFKALTIEPSSAAKVQSDVVLTIPVCFHVMHQNGPENIPDSLALLALEHLNDAFANQGYYDQGTGVDTKIEFCLGQRGRYGEPSSGIEHIESPYTEIRVSEEAALMRRIYNWDVYQYLNIFVVREIGYASAFASFPSSSGSPSDGIVIEARLLDGDPGNASILAHEAGHYLGLYHTFQAGCRNYDCLLEGDRVCDTPPDRGDPVFEGCIATNSCQTDANDSHSQNPFVGDVDDQNHNYMDYNDPACFSAFSAGQKYRMRLALSKFRPQLFNSAMCTAPAAYDVGIFEVGRLNLITCNDSLRPQLRLINHGPVQVTGCELHYRVDQGAWQVYQFPGFVRSDGSLKWVQLPSIPMPASGLHRFEAFTAMPGGQPDPFPANDSTYFDFVVPYYTGVPYAENFNDGLPQEWIQLQPYYDAWTPIALDACPSGTGPDQAVFLKNNYFDSPNGNLWFSPVFDLREIPDAVFSFDHALGKQEEFLFRQTLAVYVVPECYYPNAIPVFQKTQIGMMEASDFDLSKIWVPQSCEDWSTSSIDLSDWSGQQIQLVITSDIGFNDYHRAYLDNFRITSPYAEAQAMTGLQEHQLELWPVPTKDLLHVRLPVFGDTELELSFYDVIGRQVFHRRYGVGPGQFETAIDVTGLESGHYFLVLSDGKGRIVRRVMVGKE